MTLKSVVLQTSAANLAALKFYEVCGYQRQSLKVGYYGGVYISSIERAYDYRAKMQFQCDFLWLMEQERQE